MVRRIYRLFMQDKVLYNRLYQSYKRRITDHQEANENDNRMMSLEEEEEEEEHSVEKLVGCKKFESYIKEIKVFFEERLMESVEEEQKQQKMIERIVIKEEQVIYTYIYYIYIIQ